MDIFATMLKVWCKFLAVSIESVERVKFWVEFDSIKKKVQTVSLHCLFKYKKYCPCF